METKENIKILVDDLASINATLDRKPGSVLTPLQVNALEKMLYKNSGIEVKIQSRGDLKRMEEFYRNKLLSQNTSYNDEEWIKSDKPIGAYPDGTKYQAYGGGHWIKLGMGRYKWCTGAVFPTVGGDWNGKIMLPKESKDKPQEGSYCRRYFCILQKIGEEIAPCNTCDIRCVHSAIKEERNYLTEHD